MISYAPKFDVLPRVPERVEDPEARKRQLRLGVLLKEKQILGKGSNVRQRISVSHADRLKMQEWDKKFLRNEKAQFEETGRRMHPGMMKNSEDAIWAEWMLIEGADIDGVTKKTGNPNWFDGSVQAYLPSEYDDKLRGTDALFMFVDPEDESQAYPVSVDCSIDPEGYQKKLANDLFRAMRDNQTEVYWQDTKVSDEDFAEGERQFPDLAEGMIQTVHVSVYIPKELTEAYRNEKNPLAQADQVMEVLGPFVIRQMRAELEAQALVVIGEADQQALLRGEFVPSRVSSRKELQEKLRNPFVPQSLERRRTAQILVHALEVIYASEESWNKRLRKAAMADPGVSLRQERLRAQLPPFVKSMEAMWDGLQRRAPERELDLAANDEG